MPIVCAFLIACRYRFFVTSSTSGSMAAGVSSLNGPCSTNRLDADRQRSTGSSHGSGGAPSSRAAVQNCASSIPRPNARAASQQSSPMDETYSSSRLTRAFPPAACTTREARRPASWRREFRRSGPFQPAPAAAGGTRSEIHPRPAPVRRSSARVPGTSG